MPPKRAIMQTAGPNPNAIACMTECAGIQLESFYTRPARILMTSPEGANRLRPGLGFAERGKSGKPKELENLFGRRS